MNAVAHELVITRWFDAPRDLVWEAWTKAEHALHWWGSLHHPAIEVLWDVRVGGGWRNCLRARESGALLWHGGVFREVVRPDRLVFTFAWEESGERGMETLVTVTFVERDGGTEMTLTQVPFQSGSERNGHDEGWNSTLDRLAEYLVSQP